MAFEIKADYQQLDEVATGFQNQSDAINDLYAKVRNGKDALEQGGWIGKGSEAFFSEMNDKVMPSIERLRQVLERASDITRDISSKLHDAETQAAGYFNR